MVVRKALTIKAVQKQIQAMGLTMRSTNLGSGSNEYRVTIPVRRLMYRDGITFADAVVKSENIAYYTNDLQDALDTANAMAPAAAGTYIPTGN